MNGLNKYWDKFFPDQIDKSKSLKENVELIDKKYNGL